MQAHFTQMKKRVGAEGFRIIEAWLRRKALRLRDSQPLSAVGLVQAACVDSTDLRAWRPGGSRRSAGQGRKGFYLGYRSLFLTDMEGFPLSHVEAPANVNESLLVEPLLDGVLGEDLEVEMLAGDSGFESRRVFEALEARKVSSLVAARARRLRYGRLTWQGLENMGIHVSLVMMVVYAVAIATFRIGRPELRQSVAFLARGGSRGWRDGVAGAMCVEGSGGHPQAIVPSSRAMILSVPCILV